MVDFEEKKSSAKCKEDGSKTETEGNNKEEQTNFTHLQRKK